MDETQVLTQEELESALKLEIEDAIQYDDEYLAPSRVAATLYYKAAPFGTEEEGRSKVVMPVVRDTVRATMPSLMRIFFGAQRVVEFMPSSKTSSELAEDATETVNYVFTRLNDGWSTCWSAFKDALVRRTGWIKWWYDDSTVVTAETFTGVTEEQLYEAEATLLDYEQLDVLERAQVGEQPGEPVPVGVDPATGQPIMQPGPPVPVFEYKIRISCRKPANKIRVCAVPPDEVLLNRDARSETEARIVVHRTQKTKSELTALGVPAELLEDESGNPSFAGQQTEEVQARQPGGVMPANLTPAATEDQGLVWHFECYWYVDTDGDGISELRKVCAVGEGRKIYFNEPADEVQLASFCPDPEPHVATGLSQADSTMDLQLIESHVTRDVLDSLKASIFPRTAYVEGQVNADDVLNTEIGAAIRMRQPGMVQHLEVPFAGREAYPLLEHLEQKREQRTGIGRAAMGLDGSALQSTTPDAARQSMSAAQAQVDLIARIFAETGMKRVFRGILKLLTKHQNREMQITLNGRELKVNPSKWDPDMEVAANTGLGNSAVTEKLGLLSAVAATQKEVLLSLGAVNPLCSLREFYNTQTRMMEIAGFRDTHRFWTDPATAEERGATLKDPPPTPEQVLASAQVEIEKSKHELEALKAILLDDRERDKMEADTLLKAAEIQAQYGMQVDIAAIRALTERERADRREGEIALKEMLAAKTAPAASITVNPAKPRKVIKTPVRGPDGRITAIHEEEVS
jgi:hypothetical protein